MSICGIRPSSHFGTEERGKEQRLHKRGWINPAAFVLEVTMNPLRLLTIGLILMFVPVFFIDYATSEMHLTIISKVTDFGSTLVLVMVGYMLGRSGE